MRFAETHYLLAQIHVRVRKRIACRRKGGTVVDGVYRREIVARTERLVHAYRPEIFANVLERVAERFGDAAWSAGRREDFCPIRHGPESQQRVNARHRARPGSIVRHQR